MRLQVTEEIARGIRESAGLDPRLDGFDRLRLTIEPPALAEQFAAALAAENTPPETLSGSDIWLALAQDYSEEDLTHLVLAVTKVAHYLGLRHAGEGDKQA
jgi:hypothetical protein